MADATDNTATLTVRDKVGAYLQLTKPSIMMLVLVTGATALVLEQSMVNRPLDFFLVMLGLFLTGGSANALNQYLEREVDAKMSRTKRRRPLPMGRISPASALAFSIGIGVAGTALFWFRFNPLSAMIALATILFYAFFYTLYLKPNTAQNIVIGGAAGAMAPVIAWAAAAGTLTYTPWMLFLIVFLWTPPHFWALALYLKDDYRAVDYPMMPVAHGDDVTFRHMVIYSIALVAISLVLYDISVLYVVVAVILGGQFLRKVLAAQKAQTTESEQRLFRFSIVYLFALFLTMIVEGLRSNFGA
jgi:protoheme IX farnesyltransferase